MTLPIRTGVPCSHGLVRVGLHAGRTFAIAESLAFLEIVIPRSGFCKTQIEGAIRHALTIYKRSIYLRKCAQSGTKVQYPQTNNFSHYCNLRVSVRGYSKNIVPEPALFFV